MAIDENFDHQESSAIFFGISIASVTIGLALGGFIDATVRKFQKDDDDWKNRKFSKALGFFFVQTSLNIILLLSLTKMSKSFVPWLQLTVSGALFSVLLFTTQRNLVDNVLRLTNF
jgi:hypothetical protein